MTINLLGFYIAFAERFRGMESEKIRQQAHQIVQPVAPEMKLQAPFPPRLDVEECRHR